MSFTIKFRNTFDFDVHVDRRDEKSILLGPVYQPFFRSSSAAAAAWQQNIKYKYYLSSVDTLSAPVMETYLTFMWHYIICWTLLRFSVFLIILGQSDVGARVEIQRDPNIEVM